jgi:YVTN family beta-propeller protein
VVSNRADNTISLIDNSRLVVRTTLPGCQQAEDIAIMADSTKAFVACTGAGQVAAIDLKNDKVLALLDVGRTPVHLALKPDGGELIVCNFDSNSVSIIETNNNEVGGSYLIGTKPARAVLSADSSHLYVSNFASNTVAVYDIDNGKVIASISVGSRPDGLALSNSEDYLLVLNSQSGDVAVVQKRKSTRLDPNEYSLLTMIPVGVQPNNVVVKSFLVTRSAEK